MNKIKMLIFNCVFSGILFGQYTDGNTIVTLSKYYLKPWRTVENGDLKEREKLFDEHRTKMVFRDNLLISSNILYHYLSGNSSEVVVMNEWDNIMDADKSIKTSAEKRKKGWPNKKTREEFQKRFNEYWVGGHSDMGNYELNKKMLKRRTKKVKENTFITIQEFRLAPMSEVEGGTSEEREKIMQEWFDKIVMKDDRVLSHMMLTHYWSGSAGGPKGWPVVFINEYETMDDLLNEDLSKLLEAGWPDEKKRKAFQDKHRAYWSHYNHDDIGIYVNNIKQQKIAK